MKSCGKRIVNLCLHSECQSVCPLGPDLERCHFTREFWFQFSLGFPLKLFSYLHWPTAAVLGLIEKPTDNLQPLGSTIQIPS